MKIGLQTITYKELVEEKQLIKLIVDAGFAVLDYAFKDDSILQLSQKDFISHFEDLKKYINSCGLAVTQTHAPYYNTEAQIQRYDEVLEIEKRAIMASAILGAKYVIVHPLKPKNRVFEQAIEETFNLNKLYFEELLPVVKECDINICIENLYQRDNKGYIVPSTCSTSEEIVMYMDRLGERFFACIDTGHINLVQRESYEHVNFKHMVNSLGDRLKTVHVHDNDGVEDLHYAPYLGTVNWECFIDSLRDINYSGNLSLECPTFIRKINNENIDDGLNMLYMSAKRLYNRFVR